MKFFQNSLRLIMGGCLLITLLLSGCSRQSHSAGTGGEPAESATAAAGLQQQPSPAADQAARSRGLPVTIPVVYSTVKTNMPAGYLKEPLLFSALPRLAGKDDVSIVGSQLAVFYQDTAPRTQDDLKKLSGSGSLPIGTVLPLMAVYRAQDDTYGDFFYFEDHYNYFYQTQYMGRTGMVWGADLLPAGNTPAYYGKYAYYYTRPARSASFYDFNGTRDFSHRIMQQLADYKLALERVRQTEYTLDVQHPDDLIALYQLESRNRENTLFLSTDLFIHSLHLIFNRLLAYVEQEYFYTHLCELTAGFTGKIAALQAADPGTSPVYTEALELARIYFLVPLLILQEGITAGQAEMPEAGMEGPAGADAPQLPDYADFIRQISLPAGVEAELGLIRAAAGFGMSPNFGYREDYSQFKPRGHYTKNAWLQAYFKAMMWFGRLHFQLTTSTRAPLGAAAAEALGYTAGDENQAPADGRTVSLNLVPVMLIITKLAEDNRGLYDTWAGLFDPVTYLIGPSDDLNFRDIFPTLQQVDWSDFPAWVASPQQLTAYIAYCRQQTRSPLIAGNSVLLAPGEDDPAEAPKGYRLFGQRFTFDSFIHNQLTAPRLAGSRTMPTGLDILSAFGSQAATLLLTDEFKANPGMEEVLTRMQGQLANLDDAFWQATFYTQYLALIRNLAMFEQGAGFYFTQSSLWNIKSLQTAHAAWAELRHDTILYVKQSYAEMAGGEDYELTYRTDEIPRPVHYIEPNLPFFNGLSRTITTAVTVFSQYNVLPDIYREKFRRFLELNNFIIPLLEKEVQDLPISDEENEFITTIPHILAGLVLPETALYGGYVDDFDEFKQACIADVHTDSQAGAVLEVGTGIPHRLYVALNDGQGGKRIATGYTYSYYEFPHPMNDRLTDEQWKESVYNNPQLTGQLMPFWLKGIVE